MVIPRTTASRHARKNAELGGSSTRSSTAPLSHLTAAVDVDRLASDIGGCVTGEKEERADEVFRRQDVAQRIGAQSLLHLGFAPVRSWQRGIGEARANGVNRNAIQSDFMGER